MTLRRPIPCANEDVRCLNATNYLCDRRNWNTGCETMLEVRGYSSGCVPNLTFPVTRYACCPRHYDLFMYVFYSIYHMRYAISPVFLPGYGRVFTPGDAMKFYRHT